MLCIFICIKLCTTFDFPNLFCFACCILQLRNKIDIISFSNFSSGWHFFFIKMHIPQNCSLSRVWPMQGDVGYTKVWQSRGGQSRIVQNRVEFSKVRREQWCSSGVLKVEQSRVSLQQIVTLWGLPQRKMSFLNQQYRI